MQTPQNELGLRITAFIESEGISLSELARRLETDRSNLHRWMKGDTMPSFPKWMKMKELGIL